MALTRRAVRVPLGITARILPRLVEITNGAEIKFEQFDSVAADDRAQFVLDVIAVTTVEAHGEGIGDGMAVGQSAPVAGDPFGVLTRNLTALVGGGQSHPQAEAHSRSEERRVGKEG